jgi:uncharacterized protein
MSKSLIAATAFAATLAAAVPGASWAQAPAPASAPSAAKQQLVARMVELQRPDIEAIATALARQPAYQLMQQANAALSRLPEDQRKAVASGINEDLQGYIDDVTPIVREHADKLGPATVGPIFEQNLSDDELRQIIALLESPAYQKFKSLVPQIQRAVSEKLVAETHDQVGTRIQVLGRAMGARLKSPAAAPAAPAAASGAKR